MRAGKSLQPLAKHQRGRGEQQGHTERAGNEFGRTRQTTGSKLAHQPQRERTRRQTTSRQQPGDTPIDSFLETMHHRAARLGQRGVQQISPHRGGRVNAEHQHQQRRHQRAAAHAGQTDDGANEKPGNRVGEIHGNPLLRGRDHNKPP
jgi:hypothetical protein